MENCLGEILGAGLGDIYPTPPWPENSIMLLQKIAKEAGKCSLAVCPGGAGDKFGEPSLPQELY